MNFRSVFISVFLILIKSICLTQNQKDLNTFYFQDVEKKIIFFDDFKYDDYQFTSKYELRNDKYGYGKRHYMFYELSSRSKNEKTFLVLNEIIDHKMDFEIEVKLMITFSNELEENGIFWGLNENNEALKFAISKNDCFQIYKETKDKLIYIKPSSKCNELKSGYNKLTIRKVEKNYYYFINNVHVFSSQYEPLSAGRMGVFVSNNSSIRISEISVACFSNNTSNKNEISSQDNSEIQKERPAFPLSFEWKNKNEAIKIDNEGLDLNFAENISEWKTFCDKDQPAYCYYKFNENDSSLGLIYNYAAVRVIAPDGYHVPSKKEYQLLLEDLKKNKQTNTLCSIIPISSCTICYNCSENDYNTFLNFNLKPCGWLSVSKSKKDRWKENGEDMYFWTLETERKNSLLSGLGFAQFKSPSTIKTVDLNEINNVGAKGNNVINKEDFEFIEKYYGTFVRLIKN